MITKSLEGYPHAEFIQKCRTKLFKTDDIVEILTDWKIRGLVQKFEVKIATSKRPVSIWRATDKILSERL